VSNPTANIIHSAFKKDRPLNILTFPTHERYETGLSLTGHNFYAFRADGIKDWNNDYGKCPDNYVLLDPAKEWGQLLDCVDFDLILSQNKFGQFQYAAELSRKLQLPLVSLEHTLPMPDWDSSRLNDCRNMRGDINVFISEYSIGRWGWFDGPDTCVIKHMVDTDIFYPDDRPRENHLLSVVNDWVNRDWCCNFSGWRRISENLPVRVLGDTKGLSEPAPSITALADEYRSSRIFLNTSTISPVPTALLEAMACGCAVVSTATCMIPEVINNQINGFCSNDENELRQYCEFLMKNPNLAHDMGKQARKTIEEKFHKDRFVSEWGTVFNVASNTVYGVK
jgi:hypothetical protein